MKKQAVLTAVASLLTLASVAVLPAFALDPSTPIYKPKPRTPIEKAQTPIRERKGGVLTPKPSETPAWKALKTRCCGYVLN